jgi:hypothetical protein
VKFFFADSQDLVDPSFDFERESRNELRVRQRDDQYAHELLRTAPYDGILISKSIVDGIGGGLGRYTLGQKLRLRRLGARTFFRIDEPNWSGLLTMGDCGAFGYAKEPAPPFSVDDVLDFYEECQFDRGVSIDHVILGFVSSETAEAPLLAEWRARQELTLQLADEFLARHHARRAKFTPIGAAQGWSPQSYADSVRQLRRIGYDHIALGGMVPLKTDSILQTLNAVAAVRDGAQLHLLGVTRVEHIQRFAAMGVTSFDSTSPLRQAFMDDSDNYYWWARNFMAVRVPQSDGNSRLRLRIRSGELDHDQVLRLENQALEALRNYGARTIGLSDVLESLRAYSEVLGEGQGRASHYAETLAERPWEQCECAVCATIGIQVIVFRGAERNRRRGFHNLEIFYKRLALHLTKGLDSSVAGASN